MSNSDISTGWWLAKRPDGSASGWAPSAYLEEFASKPPPPPPPPVAARAPPPGPPASNGFNSNGSSLPAARGKPAPPPAPSKRPAGRKPVPAPPPRDSGYNTTSTADGSANVTPRESGGSMAGGLAEALRQRQAAMSAKRDDEDEW